MMSTLARRIGRVETTTRTRWLAHVDTQCPWEWTKRFREATREYRPILERAIEVARDCDPCGVRDAEPRMLASRAATTLARHSGIFQYVKRYEDWKPEPQEYADFMMAVELFSLSASYASQAGDPIPCGHVLRMPRSCWCTACKREPT